MPLLKKNISDLQLTLDPILNEPYLKAKLAKPSSSEWYNLMGEDKIGKTGLNYIYKKVGEAMTGMSSKQDFSSAATEHGLNYEREGLVEFGRKMISEGKMKENTEVKVQRLIFDDDGRTCGTPDGLWVMSEKEYSLTVRCIEVKCPFSFDGYIRLWKCKTPADVKKIEREGIKYYWQVIHQLTLCKSLIGYLVAYQPFFSSGKINVIEFNTEDKEIVADMKKVNERKKEAIEIFDNIYKELTNG